MGSPKYIYFMSSDISVHQTHQAQHFKHAQFSLFLLCLSKFENKRQNMKLFINPDHNHVKKKKKNWKKTSQNVNSDCLGW